MTVTAQVSRIDFRRDPEAADIQAMRHNLRGLARMEKLPDIKPYTTQQIRKHEEIFGARESDPKLKLIKQYRKRNDPRTVPILVGALSDWKAEVGLNAATALDHLASMAGQAPGMAREFRDALPGISGGLASEYAKVRAAVPPILAKVGELRVASQLASALCDDSKPVRDAAGAALRSLLLASERQTVEALAGARESVTTALESWDIDTKLVAVFVLGKIHDPKNLPHLAEAVNYIEPEVRVAALMAVRDFLPERGDASVAEALKEAIPRLQKGLLATKPGIKREVARLLGEVGDGRSVAPLRNRLRHDPDESVKLAAALALAQYAGAREGSPEIENALREAAQPLIAGLESDEAGDRLRCARALGTLEEDAAVAPLVARLDDPNGDVAAEAAYALGQIGLDVEGEDDAPSTSARLNACLDSSNTRLVACAAAALYRMGAGGHDHLNARAGDAGVREIINVSLNQEIGGTPAGARRDLLDETLNYLMVLDVAPPRTYGQEDVKAKLAPRDKPMACAMWNYLRGYRSRYESSAHGRKTMEINGHEGCHVVHQEPQGTTYEFLHEDEPRVSWLLDASTRELKVTKVTRRTGAGKLLKRALRAPAESVEEVREELGPLAALARVPEGGQRFWGLLDAHHYQHAIDSAMSLLRPQEGAQDLEQAKRLSDIGLERLETVASQSRLRSEQPRMWDKVLDAYVLASLDYYQKCLDKAPKRNWPKAREALPKYRTLYEDISRRYNRGLELQVGELNDFISEADNMSGALGYGTARVDKLLNFASRVRPADAVNAGTLMERIATLYRPDRARVFSQLGYPTITRHLKFQLERDPSEGRDRMIENLVCAVAVVTGAGATYQGDYTGEYVLGGHLTDEELSRLSETLDRRAKQMPASTKAGVNYRRHGITHFRDVINEKLRGGEGE